MGGLLIINL